MLILKIIVGAIAAMVGYLLARRLLDFIGMENWFRAPIWKNSVSQFGELLLAILGMGAVVLFSVVVELMRLAMKSLGCKACLRARDADFERDRPGAARSGGPQIQMRAIQPEDRMPKAYVPWIGQPKMLMATALYVFLLCLDPSSYV
ncbi:hypothetical protein GPA19_23675 [Azoarcus indigens]|uniref:Uncharacterized protein n=1 Tax=Azoarcus indigens TaxID=29545 RepID=A0A4V3BLG7_9RHOO|nr:hypothetical protein [Azoarcus indigens]NMG67946.1 hypothetical protein [Azoarcus indigens]TDN46742.1 hypothetical protein C7389_12649 [Azoarcus indigens]